MRFLEHLLLWILGKSCPYSCIQWINTGLASGDSIHDVFIGHCTVCGRGHRSELGQYWAE